jgi:hypothetical protein
MTIANQLAGRILNTMIDGEIDSDTIFEALKVTLGIIGPLPSMDLRRAIQPSTPGSRMPLTRSQVFKRRSLGSSMHNLETDHNAAPGV